MSKTVKLTKIEKKYKDKKTGEYKSLTINFAKVNDRLQEFRKDYPNSKISTRSNDDAQGRTKFKAYIWKDKSDYIQMLKDVSDQEVALLTADADASARNMADEEKDFEKLETIAVGRALAYLGYSAGGEVASSEEMENFEKYKRDKKSLESKLDVEKIQSAKTIAELLEAWQSVDKTNHDVVAAKDKRKAELSESTKA